MIIYYKNLLHSSSCVSGCPSHNNPSPSGDHVSGPLPGIETFSSPQHDYIPGSLCPLLPWSPSPEPVHSGPTISLCQFSSRQKHQNKTASNWSESKIFIEPFNWVVNYNIKVVAIDLWLVNSLKQILIFIDGNWHRAKLISGHTQAILGSLQPIKPELLRDADIADSQNVVVKTEPDLTAPSTSGSSGFGSRLNLSRLGENHLPMVSTTSKSGKMLWFKLTIQSICCSKLLFCL